MIDGATKSNPVLARQSPIHTGRKQSLPLCTFRMVPRLCYQSTPCTLQRECFWLHAGSSNQNNPPDFVPAFHKRNSVLFYRIWTALVASCRRFPHRLFSPSSGG